MKSMGVIQGYAIVAGLLEISETEYRLNVIKKTILYTRRSQLKRTGIIILGVKFKRN